MVKPSFTVARLVQFSNILAPNLSMFAFSSKIAVARAVQPLKISSPRVLIVDGMRMDFRAVQPLNAWLEIWVMSLENETLVMVVLPLKTVPTVVFVPFLTNLTPIFVVPEKAVLSIEDTVTGISMVKGVVAEFPQFSKAPTPIY